MKKEYEKAALEVEAMEMEDVMLTSGNADGDFNLPVRPER